MDASDWVRIFVKQKREKEQGDIEVTDAEAAELEEFIKPERQQYNHELELRQEMMRRKSLS